VTLVNDHVDPFEFGKVRTVFDDVLVGGEQDLEVAHTKFALESTALGRVALVGNHLDGRSPFGEFTRPVSHGRERDDDQVRSALAFDFNEEGDERDGLDGFPETLDKC